MKKREDYKLILERQNADIKQTLGTLFVVNEEDRIQFSCWALELPDLKNKSNVSRIPAGKYIVVKRWSKKFGDHIILKDVKDRQYILIHSGNTYHDTRGCILVGDDLADIDGDKHLDVLNSKDTMSKLMSMLPDKTSIMIVENEHEGGIDVVYKQKK